MTKNRTLPLVECAIMIALQSVEKVQQRLGFFAFI